MFRCVSVSLAILIAVAAFAQGPASPKAFEVATIKLTDPNFRGIGIGYPAGTLALRGFTLRDIIGFAYDMDNRQVLNIPKALESERYDVVGKADKPLGPATRGEAKLMLQSLLADRFQFRFHRETKEMSVYVLTIAKGGHKMKVRTEGDGGPPPSLRTQGPNAPGRNVPFAVLVETLQKLVVDRPIVDKTGLKGSFDFDLAWRPATIDGQTGVQPINEDRPDIFTALQEQLGLRLESQNGPTEVIAVDKAEKPSDN